MATADDSLRNLAGMMVRAGHIDAGRAIAAIANETTNRTGEPMPRKPRIITLTIQRLRDLAKDFRTGSALATADAFDRANKIDDWADELVQYDARETRLEPSKRKAKKAKRTARR